MKTEKKEIKQKQLNIDINDILTDQWFLKQVKDFLDAQEIGTTYQYFSYLKNKKKMSEKKAFKTILEMELSILAMTIEHSIFNLLN